MAGGGCASSVGAIGLMPVPGDLRQESGAIAPLTELNLLALSRDAYFTAFKDYVALLLPIFRRIHSSVAIFIDNIDRYFEDFHSKRPDRHRGQRSVLSQLLALRAGGRRAVGA
jgi:hypothetical protein